MRHLRRPGRGSRSRGQALVEFALVFPILMFLLLAVFDVGRGVFVYNALTNAAREGARLAIVNQDEALVGQRVRDLAFGNGLSNFGDADLVNYYERTPNATDPTANAACATLTVGCIAVVVAESEWSAITPIIGNVIGPITFEARSELPLELVCPNPNIPAYATAASCPRQP
jgi:hypothetical protein